MSLPNKGALYGERYRVIVTTDIGGSDPDDFQSMVHFLLYSNLFDVEGLVSAAWGAGRISDIFTVIDEYEKDFPKLIKHADNYPTPDYLRSITRQGAIDIAPYKGYTKATQASELIIECARKDDDRPLFLLMWGLLEDLAQALHDAPDIVDKLRVNYIGGPNKKWGLNAYEYILREFPNLWIIEDNSTYRGWFNGGDMTGDLGNDTFVSTHIAGHGHLGDYFATKLKGVIKMGDTPTVTYLLNGEPLCPEKDSLGGRFERVYNRPHRTYTRNTTLEDKVEIFEVIEFIFDGPVINNPIETKAYFTMIVDKQNFDGFYDGEGKYKIRFMPKEVKEWSYEIKSDIEELNGQKGQFVSVPEDRKNREDKGQQLTNWWADVLDEEWAEGAHMGAKTLNQFREVFLRSFEERMSWCK